MGKGEQGKGKGKGGKQGRWERAGRVTAAALSKTDRRGPGRINQGHAAPGRARQGKPEQQPRNSLHYSA